MPNTLRIITILLALASSIAAAIAQENPGPGGARDSIDAPPSRRPLDTLFVFPPARPLIDSTALYGAPRSVVGFDILFSSSGLGMGCYAQLSLSETTAGFVNVGITGYRNTDEFPDYQGNVPNKVNRLFMLPVTLGARIRLFNRALVDNFRPYVNGGVGPALLVALPYEFSFFPSIGHASLHAAVAGFFGCGAEIGGGRPILGVNVRYFIVPYPAGLESIRDNPITDFGGLFLTLNVGFIP